MPANAPTTEAVPPEAISFLRSLVADRVLAPFQAQLLEADWIGLPSDWASSPYLRSVPEHTRAYIDQMRTRTATPATPAKKEFSR